MVTRVPVCKPFSLPQALAFIRRFPACANEAIVTEDGTTVAFAIDSRAYAVTLRGALEVEAEAGAPAALLAQRAADFVGAADDLRGFYAAAETDRQFAQVVEALHGLHHVRFIGGLAELAVYSVLMQRAPIAQAARYQQKFLDRFGIRVSSGDRTLRAMPGLARLAQLDAAEIGDAIGHAAKAERIAIVIRGVAGLGEDFLRTAPYAQARDALLAIPGVGPFSTGAILLRGLGRMDDVPSLEMFEREGRAVYGRAWDPAAIARRYATHIGYWSFYLKVAVGRGAVVGPRSHRG